MIGKVNVTVRDGRLGIVDPRAPAIVVCAPAILGTVNTPTILYRPNDVRSLFGEAGRLSRIACRLLEFAEVPVICCKTGETTAGSYGTVTKTGVGTSVITGDGVVLPDDIYEVELRFKQATTITVGVAGALYTYSLDGGRTVSEVQALGTANTITLPVGGVKLNLAAGTLGADLVVTLRTTGPKPNGAQMASAIAAAGASSLRWRDGILGTDIVAADVSTIDTALAALEAIGKHRYFVANTRLPTTSETEATYRAALTTEFPSNTASKRLALFTGGCELQSPIDQRKLLSFASEAVITAIAKAKLGEDVAWRRLGPIDACVMKTATLNPKHHDEYTDPGLDDLRFGTLRTWESEPGVPYVGNARIYSLAGSDFLYVQHRKVMDVVCETVREVLEGVTSQPIEVLKETGFITEDEARDIELQVNSRLAQVVASAVSSVEFKLNRTDNLLSTFTLAGAVNVIPLAYPKTINVDAGFYNPALALVEV